MKLASFDLTVVYFGYDGDKDPHQQQATQFEYELDCESLIYHITFAELREGYLFPDAQPLVRCALPTLPSDLSVRFHSRRMLGDPQRRLRGRLRRITTWLSLRRPGRGCQQ